MSSSGRVALSAIWAMLDRCAPGHRKKKTKHHWCIMYGEQTYHDFPLGKHGARTDPEIEIGHIKKMARHLGILDCAREQIQTLK